MEEKKIEEQQMHETLNPGGEVLNFYEDQDLASDKAQGLATRSRQPQEAAADSHRRSASDHPTDQGAARDRGLAANTAEDNAAQVVAYGRTRKSQK